MELISEGNTAKVYRDGKKAVKVYLSMPYEAVRMEAKAQQLAFDAGLLVPQVYGVVQNETSVQFEMEFIDGCKIVWPKMDKVVRKLAFDDFTDIQKVIETGEKFV